MAYLTGEACLAPTKPCRGKANDKGNHGRARRGMTCEARLAPTKAMIINDFWALRATNLGTKYEVQSTK